MAIKLYNKEAEQQLLGLLIKFPKLVLKVSGIISSPEYFYVTFNQYVFDAIIKSHEHNKDTDPIFLIQYLGKFEEKSEDEWMTYMDNLTYSRGIEEDFEKYVRIITDKFQARKLEIALNNQIKNLTSEEKPVSDLVAEIENEIFKVTKDRELRDFEDIATVTKNFTKGINNPADDSGIKTNFKELDDILGSFQPGQLVLLAARPSMGKTAVSIELARSAARHKNVGYFSIEMPSTQIVGRMMRSGTMWSDEKIKDPHSWNKIEEETYTAVEEDISSLKMNIDDSPGIELGEITWKSRKLADKNELDIVIIDYLGLINHSITGNTNQAQIVAEVSKQLKALARDLEIPVIALAQLNRSVEKREDKRPLMSDLRDSGSLEQDADIIMFLYRDGYYNKPLTPQPYEDLEIIVSKNRNGSTGTAKLKFYMATGRITS